MSTPAPRRPHAVQLFAAALDDDARARRDLERLAVWDPVAAHALCALLTREVDELERAGGLRPMGIAEVDQLVAAVHEKLLHDHDPRRQAD